MFEIAIKIKGENKLHEILAVCESNIYEDSWWIEKAFLLRKDKKKEITNIINNSEYWYDYIEWTIKKEFENLVND